MIAALDLVCALAFTAALGVLVGTRRGALGLPARVFLAVGFAIYVFIGSSNFLEHAGLTGALDRYEDYLEILFPAVFAFFLFAARSQQEIEQRRKAEALAATEKERLAVILESIADAVVAIDVHGRILFVNAAAERLLGRRRGDVVARRIEDVVPLVDERTGQRRASAVAAALGAGSASEIAAHTALVSEDGRYRLVEDSAAPIRDEAGQVRGAVLILRDVTEKRGVQQELLKIQKLESLGVLAGGIAHDFNNILTAILGNLSLARIYTGASGKTAAILDQAETATLRARDLTRQLLTFARGGAPIKQARDIESLIRDTTIFVLRGSRIRCELQVVPDLAWVDCDEGQLRQVFNNLVLNAREAMPEGGRVVVRGENVTLEVGEVAMLRPGRYVRVTVEDEGVGITPDLLTRVFDPYFTTNEHGSGLGLATAFSIARQHDGYILAESGVGTGTRMLVYLPASARRHGTVEAARPPAGRLSGRVLLCDDEALVRDVAGRMARQLGLDVECVDDGSRAIDEYKRAHERGHPYDLVILDLTIPGGMGATETIAALAALDPSVRAIVATGYSGDAVLTNHRAHGFAGVLTKPFRLEELRDVVGAVLAAPPAVQRVAG